MSIIWDKETRNFGVLSIALALGALLPSQNLNSQELTELSLEELLNVKVSLATNSPKTVRELPSVVTLITQEEIRSSGARDLVDILKLVPGFWIHHDIDGITTLSFRGVYGYEGKVLVLLDDIELSELQFGGVQFGGHYPADIIESIEIIRGPGSVTFGGTAELAVIRINTIKDLNNEAKVSIKNTSTDGGELFHNFTINWNIQDTDWGVNLNAHIGESAVSDSVYTSLVGDSFDMQDNSDVSSDFLALSGFYKDLKFQFLYDNYEFEDRIFIGGIGALLPPNFEILTDNLQINFEKTALFLEQKFNPGESWQIDAKFTYIDDEPWRTKYPDGRMSLLLMDRTRLTLDNKFSLQDDASLLLGASWYRDQAKTTESDGVFVFDADTYFNGEDNIDYTDSAIYLQYERPTDFGLLVVGGRYDDHSYAGSKFVPRLALNTQWENTHLKLIYNEAFRIPQIDTIQTTENTGNQLKSETSKTYEIEIGTQLTPEVLVQANLYAIKIDDFVAYDTNTFAFQNLGKLETSGAELTLKWVEPWGALDLSYSHINLDKNQVASIVVPQDSERLLGVPKNKFSVNWRYHISDNSVFNASLNNVGDRFGCVDDFNFVCGTPINFSSDQEVDVYYRHSVSNWEFGVGVSNLFDEDIEVMQPYTGGVAPILELGKQYKVDFTINF